MRRGRRPKEFYQTYEKEQKVLTLKQSFEKLFHVFLSTFYLGQEQ